MGQKSNHRIRVSEVQHKEEVDFVKRLAVLLPEIPACPGIKRNSMLNSD